MMHNNLMFIAFSKTIFYRKNKIHLHRFMKQYILFMAILLTSSGINHAQQHHIGRVAESTQNDRYALRRNAASEPMATKYNDLIANEVLCITSYSEISKAACKS